MPSERCATTPGQVRSSRILRAVAAIALFGGLTVAVVPAAVAAPITAAPVTAVPVTAAAPWAAAPPAPAPVEPASADEARQAWISASRRTEQFNERVLTAEEAVATARTRTAETGKQRRAATAAVTAADAEFATAQRSADEADVVVTRAEDRRAGYRQQLDAFADASFRGARTGTLSALLLADSPDDFLDSASSLDAVASDNNTMLAGSQQAEQQAVAARAAAEQVRAEAGTMRNRADAARTAAATAGTAAADAQRRAEQARADLDTEKIRLTAEIEANQRAYARLSAADRSAAITISEDANATANGTQVRAADRSARGEGSTMSVEDLSVRAAQEAPNVAAGVAVQAALSRVGLPYVWGAIGPDTFDCSGLMMWAWNQAGVSIPRSSASQAGALRMIPMSELQPGDLITFYRPTSHVGMYIGHGLMVHASTSSQPIKISSTDRGARFPVAHAVNR